MAQDELSMSLVELSGLLLKQETPLSTLQRVVVLASQLLPGADAASITITDEKGVPSTASSTQDLVAELDAQQYRLGEGPCLAAAMERRTFQIDSMDEEPRWPRFCPIARAAGISSMLSVPLLVDGTVGAINFYARKPWVFTEFDRTVAHLFAAQAAVATANALSYSNAIAERAQMAERLDTALKSRATIDQAIGILVEREGIGPEEAFGMLRVASQRLNIKLREVARGIVDSAGKVH
jgi:GAF domain-containing protein